VVVLVASDGVVVLSPLLLGWASCAPKSIMHNMCISLRSIKTVLVSAAKSKDVICVSYRRDDFGLVAALVYIITGKAIGSTLLLFAEISGVLHASFGSDSALVVDPWQAFSLLVSLGLCLIAGLRRLSEVVIDSGLPVFGIVCDGLALIVDGRFAAHSVYALSVSQICVTTSVVGDVSCHGAGQVVGVVVLDC